MNQDDFMSKIEYAKKAANIHHNVKDHLLNNVLLKEKPIIKLYDLATNIENKIIELGGNIAFPTGLSVNHCAAHFTPHSVLDTYVVNLQADIIKIDYGVHINGTIIDSAFSFSFNPQFDNLIEATKDATTSVIKHVGVDVPLEELGEISQEVIESYGFKSVRDLCGHSIDPYVIHSGQMIPNVKISGYEGRIKDNQFYAIETFASTGEGRAICPMNLSVKDPLMSHFMINTSCEKPKKTISKKERKSLDEIKKIYGTLPFCKRWLNNKLDITGLVGADIVSKYPPLYDKKGSYVSQHEHTIVLYNEMKKEVL